jgi:hypothetical protein
MMGPRLGRSALVGNVTCVGSLDENVMGRSSGMTLASARSSTEGSRTSAGSLAEGSTGFARTSTRTLGTGATPPRGRQALPSQAWPTRRPSRFLGTPLWAGHHQIPMMMSGRPTLSGVVSCLLQFPVPLRGQRTPCLRLPGCSPSSLEPVDRSAKRPSTRVEPLPRSLAHLNGRSQRRNGRKPASGPVAGSTR